MPVPKVVANEPVLIQDCGRQDHGRLPGRPSGKHTTGRATEEHAETTTFVSTTTFTGRDAPLQWR